MCDVPHPSEWHIVLATLLNAQELDCEIATDVHGNFELTGDVAKVTTDIALVLIRSHQLSKQVSLA